MPWDEYFMISVLYPTTRMGNACSSSSVFVTIIRITSPLTVFLKYGELDFSEAFWQYFWPKVAPPDGKICNKLKWRLLKLGTQCLDPFGLWQCFTIWPPLCRWRLWLNNPRLYDNITITTEPRPGRRWSPWCYTAPPFACFQVDQACNKRLYFVKVDIEYSSPGVISQ